MSAFVGLNPLQNIVRKLAKDPLVVIMVVGNHGECSRVPSEVHRLQRQEKSITKKIFVRFLKFI